MKLIAEGESLTFTIPIYYPLKTLINKIVTFLNQLTRQGYFQGVDLKDIFIKLEKHIKDTYKGCEAEKTIIGNDNYSISEIQSVKDQKCILHKV